MYGRRGIQAAAAAICLCRLLLHSHAMHVASGFPHPSSPLGREAFEAEALTSKSRLRLCLRVGLRLVTTNLAGPGGATAGKGQTIYLSICLLIRIYIYTYVSMCIYYIYTKPTNMIMAEPLRKDDALLDANILPALVQP